MNMTVTELQEQAIEQTKYWINFASDKYGIHFRCPNVSFKLKGRTAGKACISRNEVRYNAVLLEENGETFISRTIPHEVAHFVARAKYGNIKSHGYEWQRVMRDFGLDPSRCHSYDTTNSKQQSKKMSKVFSYKCRCRIYNLTIIRHRRIAKGATYTCRTCKSALAPA